MRMISLRLLPVAARLATKARVGDGAVVGDDPQRVVGRPAAAVEPVPAGLARGSLVGQRATDVGERELAEATRVDVRLRPASLQALDTLIMAGVADDRAAAVRLVLARFGQQPEYEQLRERSGRPNGLELFTGHFRKRTRTAP
jgi:hypothetical protein